MAEIHINERRPAAGAGFVGSTSQYYDFFIHGTAAAPVLGFTALPAEQFGSWGWRVPFLLSTVVVLVVLVIPAKLGGLRHRHVTGTTEPAARVR